MKQPRYSGFVVGKDKVRGQDTWKVRVKDDTSPLNSQKLKVASVWPGVTLAKGMNVEFAISEQRNAVNVAPCGVKTEGNPDMRKILIIASSVLAVAAVALIFAFTAFKAEINDLRTEWRVERLVDTLANASLYDLVPDEIVRRQIQTGWLNPVAARDFVFEESVCVPVLGRDSLIEPEGRNNECFNARYPVYNGTNEPRSYDYEADESPSSYLTRSRLPRSTWNEWADTRYLIMQTAREHLSDPARLEAFYQAKLNIVVNEVNRLSMEERVELIEQLKAQLALFERFNDSAVRDALTELDEAVEDSSAAFRRYAADEITWDEYRVFMEAREAAKDQLDRTIGHCETRSFESGNTYEYCPGEYEIRFANRRFAEGGQELVDTWIRLGYDLLEQFNR